MTLAQFCLSFIESRWVWLGFKPPLPARNARWSFTRVIIFTLGQALVGATIGWVLSLLLPGRFYSSLSWLIWLLAGFSACQGIVSYGLTAICWNQRASRMRADPALDVSLPPARYRSLRFLLGLVYFALLAVITPVVVLLTVENLRGRYAWEKFRQEWEAKGERFDLASFIPKPVPPEQNFAMTPFLAPLLDYELTGSPVPPPNPDDNDVAERGVRWRDSKALARVKSVTIHTGEDRTNKAPSLGNWQRGQLCDLKAWQAFYRSSTNLPVYAQPQDPARDVISALQQFEPVLTELRIASLRPYAFFPVHYADGSVFLLPHLVNLKSLALVPALRASANLEANQSELALADVNLAFHFAKSLQSEPFLLSQLVRLAIVQVSIQPVWEGLAKHRWSDAQLEELQKKLTSIQLLEDYGVAMRGERACNNEGMAQIRAGRDTPKPIRMLIPSGMFYHNQVATDRLYQEAALPAVDAAQHRVYPEKCGTNVVASVLKKPTPYNVLAWMMFPAVGSSAERFARTQTSVDLATVACALERYRIANNKYPEALDVLTSRFIAKLPTDIINGQPLKYRLDENGQPVFYSVGWNQTLDDTQLALIRDYESDMKKGGRLTKNYGIDMRKGGWIWHYPAK